MTWRSRMHRMQDASRTYQTNGNVSNAALEHKGSWKSKQPRKSPSRPIIHIGFTQYSDIATLDLTPYLLTYGTLRMSVISFWILRHFEDWSLVLSFLLLAHF